MTHGYLQSFIRPVVAPPSPHQPLNSGHLGVNCFPWHCGGSGCSAVRSAQVVRRHATEQEPPSAAAAAAVMLCVCLCFYMKKKFPLDARALLAAPAGTQTA